MGKLRTVIWKRVKYLVSLGADCSEPVTIMPANEAGLNATTMRSDHVMFV